MRYATDRICKSGQACSRAPLKGPGARPELVTVPCSRRAELLLRQKQQRASVAPLHLLQLPPGNGAALPAEVDCPDLFSRRFHHELALHEPDSVHEVVRKEFGFTRWRIFDLTCGAHVSSSSAISNKQFVREDKTLSGLWLLLEPSPRACRTADLAKDRMSGQRATSPSAGCARSPAH